MLRSREEAQADLVDLEATLRLIPVQAFARYSDKQREERAYFRPRVQADVIHAYMEKEGRALLWTVWNVVLALPTNQAFYFDVSGKWRFRVHKLNDDFTVENNRTALALDFLEQADETLSLDLNAPRMTNLHLGYRLNPAKSGLASVHIVCPIGEGNIAWQYILPESSDGLVSIEPVRPDGPKPRIRPDVEPVEAPRREGESGA